MEQSYTLEGDKKYIELQQKKLLLIYDGFDYDSLVLTDKSEKFIIYDIESDFLKKTDVLHYLIQVEDKININLN